jgi:hypothetical protein
MIVLVVIGLGCDKPMNVSQVEAFFQNLTMTCCLLRLYSDSIRSMTMVIRFDSPSLKWFLHQQRDLACLHASVFPWIFSGNGISCWLCCVGNFPRWVGGQDHESGSVHYSQNHAKLWRAFSVKLGSWGILPQWLEADIGRGRKSPCEKNCPYWSTLGYKAMSVQSMANLFVCQGRG